MASSKTISLKKGSELVLMSWWQHDEQVCRWQRASGVWEWWEDCSYCRTGGGGCTWNDLVPDKGKKEELASVVTYFISSDSLTPCLKDSFIYFVISTPTITSRHSYFPQLSNSHFITGLVGLCHFLSSSLFFTTMELVYSNFHFGEEMSEKHRDCIRVDVNIYCEKSYFIKTFPSFLFYKNGKKAGEMIGFNNPVYLYHLYQVEINTRTGQFCFTSFWINSMIT